MSSSIITCGDAATNTWKLGSRAARPSVSARRAMVLTSSKRPPLSLGVSARIAGSVCLRRRARPGYGRARGPARAPERGSRRATRGPTRRRPSMPAGSRRSGGTSRWRPPRPDARALARARAARGRRLRASRAAAAAGRLALRGQLARLALAAFDGRSLATLAAFDGLSLASLPFTALRDEGRSTLREDGRSGGLTPVPPLDVPGLPRRPYLPERTRPITPTGSRSGSRRRSPGSTAKSRHDGCRSRRSL